MKIGLAVLCAGTVVFMLRVLIALLAETTDRFNLPTKIYMAKFNPKSKPSIRTRDLIIMKSNEDIEKPPTRKATGTALVLAALLLALPAHAGQTSDTSFANPGASPRQPSTTDQVLVKELGAMKKAGKEEPFAFADWTRLNGNPRTETLAFDSRFYAREIEADIDYIYGFKTRFKLSQFVPSRSSDIMR
jgi:hypothetical protein